MPAHPYSRNLHTVEQLRVMPRETPQGAEVRQGLGVGELWPRAEAEYPGDPVAQFLEAARLARQAGYQAEAAEYIHRAMCLDPVRASAQVRLLQGGPARRR